MRTGKRKRMLWAIAAVIAVALALCGCANGGGNAPELTVGGKAFYYGMEQAEAEKGLAGEPNGMATVLFYENATVIFRDKKLVFVSASENAKCGGVAIGDAKDKILEKYRDILETQKPYLANETDATTVEDYLEQSRFITVLYAKNGEKIEPFEGTVLEFEEQVAAAQRQARGDRPTDYYYLSFEVSADGMVGRISFGDYRAATIME